MKLMTPWLIAVAFMSISSAHAVYTLESAGDIGDCEQHTVLHNGQAVKLPNAFKDAMQCPVMINLNGDRLVLLKGNDVLLYRLKEQKTVRLFSVWPDISGLSEPVWSPDGQGVALVSIIRRGPHAYATDTRLITVRLDSNDKLVAKEKFDRPIVYGCRIGCLVLPNKDLRYLSNNTIAYRQRSDKQMISVTLKSSGKKP